MNWCWPRSNVRRWCFATSLIVIWSIAGGAVRAAGAGEGPLAGIVWPADTYATLSSPPAPQAQDPAAAEPKSDEPAAQVAAEETRSFVSTLFHNLADDTKHLPRRNSVYWTAGGAALAFAVHPADQRLNRRLRGSETWDRIFIPGKIVGETSVQVGAGLLTYGIGRMRGSNRARHLGMDLIEAQLLTEGIVEGLKLVGRRPRPLNPDGTPNSSHSYSFPSGHAAVTFAGATVLQQHLGWKAAVPTYLVASYVALSRLHDNRHYLSDIVFGAATGVIVGRAVTWHGRNNYPIQPVVGPDLVGVVIEWR